MSTWRPSLISIRIEVFKGNVEPLRHVLKCHPKNRVPPLTIVQHRVNPQTSSKDLLESIHFLQGCVQDCLPSKCLGRGSVVIRCAWSFQWRSTSFIHSPVYIYHHSVSYSVIGDTLLPPAPLIHATDLSEDSFVSFHPLVHICCILPALYAN